VHIGQLLFEIRLAERAGQRLDLCLAGGANQCFSRRVYALKQQEADVGFVDGSLHATEYAGLAI
jgi:hypothetical protein